MSTKWFSDDKRGIKERLIRGIKWNMAEAVITAVSNLMTAVVAARLLGLDDFGAFSIIRSTVYMMASVAELSMGLMATKYVAELRNSQQEKVGRVLGLCLIVTVVTGLAFSSALLGFAPQIAASSLGAPQLADQLRFASIYIFFVTLNGYQIGALVGFEAFGTLAKLNLVQAISSLTVTLLLTWMWGLTGISLALGFSAFFTWLLYHYAIRRELRKHKIRISYSKLGEERKLLTSFALPSALSGIIGALAVWFCNAFLVRQPEGFKAMAVFTVAYTFRSLILFVPGLVTRVVSPILCNLVGVKDLSNYSRVFLLNLITSAGAAAIVATALVVAGPYALLLFGREFTGGTLVLLVIAVMSVVEVVANTLFQPLFAHGKVWWQVLIICCWSCILVTLTMVFSGDYGALGLAYAYLAAHVVSSSMYFYVMRRIEKKQKNVSN